MHRPGAASPSSRGLGHRPFTAVTGVRIPLGTPTKSINYAARRKTVSRKCPGKMCGKSFVGQPRHLNHPPKSNITLAFSQPLSAITCVCYINARSHCSRPMTAVNLFYLPGHLTGDMHGQVREADQLMRGCARSTVAHPCATDDETQGDGLPAPTGLSGAEMAEWPASRGRNYQTLIAYLNAGLTSDEAVERILYYCMRWFGSRRTATGFYFRCSRRPLRTFSGG